MKPTASRRQFLVQLGAASAGTLASGVSFAGERSAKRTGVARRSLRRVSRILENYSDAFCLYGPSAVVEATAGDSAPPVHMLAKSSEKSIHAFFAQQGGLPFRKVYVDGNIMSFRFGSRDFIVENLPSDAYQDRMTHIHTQGSLGETTFADYAHQYVTYDLKAKRFNDPHGAVSAGKPVLRSVYGANLSTWTLTSVTRGMVDSALLGAVPDKAIQRAWQNYLSETGDLSDEIAEQIVSELVSQFAVLADYLKAEDVSKLLCSKRVGASLQKVLGVKPSAIVGSHQNLQQKAKRGTAPRVVWLAALLSVGSSQRCNRLLRDTYLTNTDLTARRSAGDDWRKAMHLI